MIWIKINIEKSTYNIDINEQDLKDIAYLLNDFSNSIKDQECDTVKQCRKYYDQIDKIIRFSSKYEIR